MAETVRDDDRPAAVLRVLGPLEVGRAGSAAEPVPGRLGRLLAALTLQAGTVVSADRLADIIWTDDDRPGNPEGALQNLVSRLRVRLRRSTVPFDVLHRPPGYYLDIDVRLVDATRFDELASAALRDVALRPDRALTTLDEALALWRGRAYAEFADDDFVRPEVARLEELRLAAEEARAEAALNLGQHHEVTARLERLAGAEPLRERPHRLLVLAHHRTGRQADALAVARTYRRRLQDELGLDPSPAMAALEAEVLRQDPALAWSGRADAGGAGPPRAGGARGTGPARQRTARQTPSPAAAGGLVGRDDDLDVLRERAAAGSLLTLTGPGGVGKTTLALRVAADVGGRFDDGTAVAELVAVSHPDEVVPAVLTALGVQPRQGVGHLDRLVEYLRSRGVLLVLDNCEHVVEAAAALAHEVHRSCPRVAVLATSRFPLEVPDERLWAVPPLALPPVPSTAAGAGMAAADAATSPAVRLFVERAAARSRTFALDDSNVRDVVEVCRRLDGLPLAIELAAARIGSLSPADLVQRMSWRFHLLHGGPRTGAERHRTLRAVVDWSYALLAPTEQRVFEALSVFSGSFPLDLAEELLQAVPDGGARALLDLVDRSMVVIAAREPTTRYAILETLRAYGRERLEARGDDLRVQRTHAELFARVVQEAAGHMYRPGHVAAVERVGAAFDELRAAVAWAVEHDAEIAARLVGAMAIYVEHRIPAEVPEWAERTLSAAAHADGTVPGLAAVHAVAAACARFAGDLDGAASHVHAGLEIAVTAGERAYLSYLLAEVRLFQGRITESQQAVDDAVSGLATEPVTRMTAVCGPLLAIHRGDLPGAQSRAREVLRAVERAGEEVTKGWAAYVYGETLIDTDPALATALVTDALATGRRLGERYLTGVALTSAASVRGRHGDALDAAPLFRDVLEHWRQVGDWTHQWTALRNVAELLVRLRRDREAAVLHGALVGRGDTVPLFGADAVRMTQAREVLQQRLGADTFTTLCESGRRLSDDEVVATAAGYLA